MHPPFWLIRQVSGIQGGRWSVNKYGHCLVKIVKSDSGYPKEKGLLLCLWERDEIEGG